MHGYFQFTREPGVRFRYAERGAGRNMRRLCARGAAG